MDDKIVKLQEATDMAHQAMTISHEAFQQATKDLEEAKTKYKKMSEEKQQAMPINDTELPELIETQLRAKNVYETSQTRYETNLKYLTAFKQKAASQS